MNPGQQRIYVGNLPFDITESEVSTKFSKYGTVLKVELKYRSDPFSDVGLPCYAFLDLQIDPSKIDRCFRKVSNKKWKGHSVKLELAKESFLSRLEKERQENSSKRSTTASIEASPVESLDIKLKKNDTKQKTNKVTDGNTTLRKVNKHAHVKDEIPLDEDGQERNSELVSTVLDKFESFSDMWKDIPSQQSAGQQGKANFQKAKETKRKETDEKMSSEQKRLKSLAVKKEYYFQQKEAVKLALSAVDTKRTSSNRKVFNDDYEDGLVPNTATANECISKVSVSEGKLANPSNKKPSLFEENESADEDDKDIDFKIKKQFEGKKGQKLLELQSQFASDQRFALDERFYDSDDNGEQENPADNDDISGGDERKRQLEILQNIVGHELPSIPERKSNLIGTSNFMLRFDPTNADHARYEVKETETKPLALPLNKSEQKKIKKAEKKKKKPETETTVLPSKVSKETFYKVADTLTESLKTKENGGFSLLKMFGSNDDAGNANEAIDVEDVHSSSIPLSKSGMDWASNPFKHDSSESETEDVTEQPTPALVDPSQGPAQAFGIWRETFFFRTDDVRLSEGLEFFSKKNDSEENFSERRKELKQIINAKVKHNLRKSLPKKTKLGGSPFNRFRDTKKKNRGGSKKFKTFRKK